MAVCPGCVPVIELVAANDGAPLKQFIRLPRVLYKHMPGYSPPLDYDRTQILHPKKGGFYRDGEAHYWLAMRDGVPVGRISAQVDHRQRALPGNEEIGLFGCLDAIDDRAVVEQLLVAARDWLRKRRVQRMQGPHLLNMNTEPGLMIAGQDQPPQFLAPWHPAYLQAHVEANGLVKAQDLGYFAVETNPEIHQPKIDAFRPRKLMKTMTMRSLRLKKIDEEAQIAAELYNDAWKDNWGFIPLEPHELAQMFRGLWPLISSKYGVFLESDGEAVGVAMAVPNIMSLTTGLNGAPNPHDWLRLGWRVVTRPMQSARIILFGVRKDYRHTVVGSAIARMLLSEMLQRGIDINITHTEAGWVLDDNIPLIKIMQFFGMVQNRTYRIYERQLEGE